MIAFQARTRPNAVAACAVGEPELTFAGIHTRSLALTDALRSHGVGPGDRVALLLPTGFEAGVLTGLAMAAAAAVPLDPESPPGWLASAGNRLRPALAIVAPGMEAIAGPLGCPAVALLPGLRLPTAAAGARAAAPAAPAAPGPDDPGMILATSGSTGASRLVPRHHAQYLDVLAPLSAGLALHPAARFLSAAKPFHALGAAPFIKAVAAGACTVFARSSAPADILAAISAFRPTATNLPPATYDSLLEVTGGAPLPPFERILSSAAPFPPTAARAAETLFGAPLIRDYGLSEAICLGFAPPNDGYSLPTYRPLLPGSIAIAAEDGTFLPPGETGEIVARGPHVFHGYIGGDGSEFFPGGWFRTGDLGVMAGDGSFAVTGRLKHLISRGGVKISPAEIEQALHAHPDIAAAAAIPVPHPSLGEDIVAVIVLRPGAAPAAREIRRWLLDRLTPSHTPRSILFRDHLPMTSSAKLDRMALIAEIAASSEVHDR
ncbi:MAG: class I adenylate-forming enzyme family protein [Chloroflexota bacterium]